MKKYNRNGNGVLVIILAWDFYIENLDLEVMVFFCKLSKHWTLFFKTNIQDIICTEVKVDSTDTIKKHGVEFLNITDNNLAIHKKKFQWTHETCIQAIVWPPYDLRGFSHPIYYLAPFRDESKRNWFIRTKKEFQGATVLEGTLGTYTR